MKKFLSKNWLVISMAVALLGVGVWGKAQYDKHQNWAGKAKSAFAVVSEMNERLFKARTDLTRSEDTIKALNEEIDRRVDEIADQDKRLVAAGKLIATLKARGKGKVVVKTVVKEVPVERERGPIETASEDPDFEGIEEESVCDKYLYSDFRMDAALNTCETPPIFEYHLSQRFRGILLELEEDGIIDTHLILEELRDDEVVGELKIEDFVVRRLEQSPFPSLEWWAPHIDMGGSVTVSPTDLVPSATFSLGLSMGGYGLTKDDQSWRFPRISLEMGENLGLGLAPVGANLGKILPVFSDLWIWPAYQYDGSHRLGMTLGTTL